MYVHIYSDHMSCKSSLRVQYFLSPSTSAHVVQQYIHMKVHFCKLCGTIGFTSN